MKINNYSLFIIVFLFSIGIHSQSLDMLDEDYIDSLPDDVASDLQDEIEKTKDSEKNTLKSRPSSELSKYDTVKMWEDFKRRNDENIFKSERYGLNLFRTMQSSFMPINEPNFGNNYILDYGDVLSVYLYGVDNDDDYLLEIGRNGTIEIPDVGSIYIAGLNFNQAVEVISKAVKSSLIGAELTVQIEEIRDIKVLITGNAEFPGIYTASGGANVLQIINMAGGVKENGSLREIEVKRNGEIIQTVDLYESLLFGNLSSIINLQSGDSIYIKPSRNIVRAGSGFNNEALFELKDGETFADLIKYAGGLDRSIQDEKFVLISTENNIKVTKNLNKNDVQKIKAKHLDSLYVEYTKYGVVELKGEVLRPGKYNILPGDDLYDVIKRAGGYTDFAYPLGGIITTEKAKKLQKDTIEKSYNDIIQYIAQQPERMAYAQNIAPVLTELKDLEPTGRVVAEFDLIEMEKNPEKRILINDKDQIYIPSMERVVYVYGDVGNPTGIAFNENNSLRDYIDLAGGQNRTADSKHIYVISPDGNSQIANFNNFLKLSLDNVEIYPGSLIYVPKEVGRAQGVNYYATIAPIFSSLALSLASLNSIND
jgi:protein involved in polysaccharide export with SLBB domain